MSRKGNKRIEIADSVEVANTSGTVTVKGPKGELQIPMRSDFDIAIEDKMLSIVNNAKGKDAKAFHGLYQSLIANMVEGVSNGFQQTLELFGVGYRVQKKGNNLELSLGYSHPVVYEAIEGIDLDIDGQTTIIIKGIDKQKVGQTAASIIKLRDAKKDPYKGKGIKRQGAVLRKKVGKKIK